MVKTGGLGNVAAALPSGLSALGVDMRPIMPAYESVWSPANDRHLPAPYDAEAFEEKEAYKAHMQLELGLAAETGPLIAIVNRLTAQAAANDRPGRVAGP